MRGKLESFGLDTLRRANDFGRSASFGCRSKDGEEWALEMERNIDRKGSSKPRAARNVYTFGDLIDLHDEDMHEVGRPPRRPKAAVVASLKTALGSVKLPALNRERLIEFGRKDPGARLLAACASEELFRDI